jgi:hypothetical protein
MKDEAGKENDKKSKKRENKLIKFGGSRKKNNKVRRKQEKRIIKRGGRRKNVWQCGNLRKRGLLRKKILKYSNMGRRDSKKRLK